MGVKDSTLNTKLDVAQFGIIDEFRVDTRPTAERSVSNFLYRITAVASGKNVGQQQRRSFILLDDIFILVWN